MRIEDAGPGRRTCSGSGVGAGVAPLTTDWM